MRPSQPRHACFLATFTFLLIATCLHAQKPIDNKIKQVESNLYPLLQIEDSVYRPSTIEQRLKELGINGVSVAVINNYKLDWAKGYGMADVKTNKRVTAGTLFLAGSISKSVNALGVLRLADQKKIDLEKNINDYLRSWKFPEDSFSKNKKITIANLLSHSAGLSVHGFPGYTPGDSVPTVKQILDGQRPANTAAVRSIFEPGLKFKYSGGGTTISQLIVSDVSGLPYENYMQKEVLQPLGMNNSTYKQPYTDGNWESYATAYYGDGKDVKGRFHVYPEMAAAGLWTHPTDLSKFIIETQLSYAGKSNKVLSQNATKRMLTFYVDSVVGLGVFFNKEGGKQFFSHGGADEGFRATYFGSFQDGYGAIVMVNSDNGRIMNEILSSIENVYGWPKQNKVTKRKTIVLPIDSVKQFAGKYYFNDGDSATVVLQNDAPYIYLNNDTPAKIYFTTSQSFFTFRYPYKLEFVKKEDNSFDLHVSAGQLHIGRKRK